MAIVASYDWESDSWTHNGDNPARTAWREAVAEIAEKAKATLPECNGRVDKAAAIVLNGDVELLDDGKAKVASQSNGQTVYHIANGECDCKDYPKAPSNWCKHRIARGLHVRATALAKAKLAQLDGASNGQTEAPSQAIPASHEAPEGEAQVWRSNTTPAPTTPLPEAPVSITLKGLIHGQEVMVTLRGTDFASVKVQVEHASQWLQEQGAPTTVTAPEADGPAPLPRCHTHGVALRRFEKDGRTWFSHKTADGQWCKGK